MKNKFGVPMTDATTHDARRLYEQANRFYALHEMTCGEPLCRVAADGPRFTLRCTHCGERLTLPLPTLAVAKQLEELYRDLTDADIERARKQVTH